MPTREELIARGVLRPAGHVAAVELRPQESRTLKELATAKAAASAEAPTVPAPRATEDDNASIAVPAPIDRDIAQIPLPQLPFNHVSKLHEAITLLAPAEFVSHYLFEPVPFAFGGDMASWIRWKTTLAASLQVDPREIVLIGSAAIGFSLNPTKNFASFNANSDIDVGVVSQHHFELGWRYLRQRQPEWLSISSDAKNAIKIHRRNYVFKGTIATDFILNLLPFGAEWQAGLNAMAGQAPTKGRDIKVRIYRDFDALRYYHSQGVTKLKAALESVGIADEEDIAIEG